MSGIIIIATLSACALNGEPPGIFIPGVPVLTIPVFWKAQKARKNFFEHEPVIAIEIGSEARAYPLSMLTYHEIVNDSPGGVSITVTYCPLCNASIVFDDPGNRQHRLYTGKVDSRLPAVERVIDIHVNGKMHFRRTQGSRTAPGCSRKSFCLCLVRISSGYGDLFGMSIPNTAA